MAKKKPGRPKSPEQRRAFQIRIPPDLDDSLEKQCSQSRRNKNTEVQIALEKYLSELGVWSPPADAGD